MVDVAVAAGYHDMELCAPLAIIESILGRHRATPVHTLVGLSVGMVRWSQGCWDLSSYLDLYCTGRVGTGRTVWIDAGVALEV